MNEEEREFQERKFKEMLQKMEKLPLEAQQAVGWIIENIDFVEKWQFAPMTLEEKNRYIAELFEKEGVFAGGGCAV